MKKTRDSNIELLRILAMIMIIAGHFAAHGIFKVNAPNPYSIFPVGSFSNRVITVLLVPGGKVGVALFFMISGFFGIDRKKAPDLTKTISTVFFYAACLFVLSLVLRVAHTVDVSLGKH